MDEDIQDAWSGGLVALTSREFREILEMVDSFARVRLYIYLYRRRTVLATWVCFIKFFCAIYFISRVREAVSTRCYDS